MVSVRALPMPDPLRCAVIDRDCYLIPRDPFILIGSTVEDCGFDYSTTLQAREELLHAGCRIYPALQQMPFCAQVGRPATGWTTLPLLI